jgi:hypothetical protein
MDCEQANACQSALIQIWETIHDQEAGNRLSTDSQLQCNAAFANIEALHKALLNVPLTESFTCLKV